MSLGVRFLVRMGCDSWRTAIFTGDRGIGRELIKGINKIPLSSPAKRQGGGRVGAELGWGQARGWGGWQSVGRAPFLRETVNRIREDKYQTAAIGSLMLAALLRKGGGSVAMCEAHTVVDSSSTFPVEKHSMSSSQESPPILKWVKLLILVLRLWKFVFETANVSEWAENPYGEAFRLIELAVIVYALREENPSKDSLYDYLIRRTRQKGAQAGRELPPSSLIPLSLEEIEVRSPLARMDVRDFHIFSTATVELPMNNTNLTLLGFLGDWWLVHEGRVVMSTSARSRRGFTIIVDDFLESIGHLYGGIADHVHGVCDRLSGWL